MKKQGFTLVELLVVITIIGLLIAIAVPSGIAISKKIKEKMLDTKIEIIENGAIEWGQNNKSKISIGTNACFIEEIINDESVSHCINIPLNELLDKNALEEDKLEDIDDDGKKDKVLINPVTNKPLNNCGVEIYIKNKRIYAKYDITGTNCGYENEEEPLADYKIVTNNIETCKLESSENIYKELINSNAIEMDLNVFKNYKSDCLKSIEESIELQDLNGNKIKKEDYILVVQPSDATKKSGVIKKNYTIKINYNGQIITKEITQNIEDNDAPILINEYLNYQNKWIIDNNSSMFLEDFPDLSTGDDYDVFRHYTYTFDNYDGLKEYDTKTILDSIPEISSTVGGIQFSDEDGQTFTLEDTNNNKVDYHLNIGYYKYLYLKIHDMQSEYYIYGSYDIPGYKDIIETLTCKNEWGNATDGCSAYINIRMSPQDFSEISYDDVNICTYDRETGYSENCYKPIFRSTPLHNGSLSFYFDLYYNQRHMQEVEEKNIVFEVNEYEITDYSDYYWNDNLDEWFDFKRIIPTMLCTGGSYILPTPCLEIADKIKIYDKAGNTCSWDVDNGYSEVCDNYKWLGKGDNYIDLTMELYKNGINVTSLDAKINAWRSTIEPEVNNNYNDDSSGDYCDEYCIKEQMAYNSKKANDPNNGLSDEQRDSYRAENQELAGKLDPPPTYNDETNRWNNSDGTDTYDPDGDGICDYTGDPMDDIYYPY